MQSHEIAVGKMELEELKEIERLAQPAVFLEQVTNFISEEVANFQETNAKLTQLREQINKLQNELKLIPRPSGSTVLKVLADEPRVKSMRATVLQLQEEHNQICEDWQLLPKLVDVMDLTCSLLPAFIRNQALHLAVGEYCYQAALLQYRRLVQQEYQVKYLLLDRYSQDRQGLQSAFQLYLSYAKKYLPKMSQEKVKNLLKRGDAIFEKYDRKYERYDRVSVSEEKLPQMQVKKLELPSSASPDHLPLAEENVVDPVERTRRKLEGLVEEFYCAHKFEYPPKPTRKGFEATLSPVTTAKLTKLSQSRRAKVLDEIYKAALKQVINPKMIELQNKMPTEFSWILDDATHQQMKLYFEQLVMEEGHPELILTQMPVTKNFNPQAAMFAEEFKDKPGEIAMPPLEPDPMQMLRLEPLPLPAMQVVPVVPKTEVEMKIVDEQNEPKPQEQFAVELSIPPELSLSATPVVVQQSTADVEMEHEPEEKKSEEKMATSDEVKETKAATRKKEKFRHPLGNDNELLAVAEPFKNLIKLITTTVKGQAAMDEQLEQAKALVAKDPRLLYVTSLEPLAAGRKIKSDAGNDALRYAAKYCRSSRMIAWLLKECAVTELRFRGNPDNGKTIYQLGNKNGVFKKELNQFLVTTSPNIKPIVGEKRKHADIISSSGRTPRAAAVKVSAKGFYGRKKQVQQKQADPANEHVAKWRRTLSGKGSG